MIKLRDALNIMELLMANGKPRPFSITFCTADLSRNTGGEIITYEKAVLHRLKSQRKNFKISKPVPSNAPRHNKNRTRNICALGNSEIRKVHIDLILEINGQQIP